jgi:Cytosine deaminase and related metal-dependent hydrolases
MTISRRSFLGLSSATALTALTGLAGSRGTTSQTPTSRLYNQNDYILIQGGRVLTLDPQLGELSVGDVLIQGDEIVAVGTQLSLPGPGVVINAANKLVTPGLIDNHRHLWVTLLRGFSANHTFNDYFGQVLLTVSPNLTTDHVYLGCLLGAYEALNAGVTTVLDWNHGTNTRDHALAAITALRDSGIRAVFAYSSPAADSVRADAPPSTVDLDAVQSVIQNDPLITLAIATRNPENATTAGLQRIADDIAEARQRGVPVTLHTGFGFGPSAPQWLANEDLLGPDITFIHGNAFSSTDLDLIAEAGAFISSSPDTELQMGLGAPPLRAMLDAGVKPTVSVDVVAAASGDLRTQLRLLLQTQRLLDSLASQPGPMLPWSALTPYVTHHAAASLLLDDQIGRLAPGMQADVVLIDLADPAVAPLESAELTMLTAPPSAVHTVLVAGQIVKQNGQLVVGDLAWLRNAVEIARNNLLNSL